MPKQCLSDIMLVGHKYLMKPNKISFQEVHFNDKDLLLFIIDI